MTMKRSTLNRGTLRQKGFNTKYGWLLAAAVAGVGLGGSPLAFGGIMYWNGTDSNNTTSGWNAVGAWSSSATSQVTTTVPGSGDTAVFNQTAVTAAQIVDLNANQAALGIQFASTATGGVTIQNGTGTDILTIGTGGITMASGAGAVSISSAVALAGAETWTNNSSSSLLTVSGNISNGSNTLTIAGAGNTAISGAIGSGGGGLILNASGILSLGAANTYTGGTTLTAGTLNLNNTKAVGTGTFVINGGIIDTTNTTAGLTAVNNAMTWGGNFTFAGTASFNLGTGAVTLGTNVALTANANTLTVGGTISGTNYGLSKGGAGTLVLSGTSTYTGTTTVTSGTLIAGVNALGNLGPFAGSFGNGSGDKNLTLSSGTTAGMVVGESITSASIPAGETIASITDSTHLAVTTGVGNNKTPSDLVVGQFGAFGESQLGGAVLLGNTANSATGNAALLTGGAFTIGRPITVQALGTGATQTATLGGNTDNNSTFSGLITMNRSLTVSQVANTTGNALSITGGITSGLSGTQTVTFSGPGNINVSTTSIGGGTGTIAVVNAGGTVTLSGANSYTGGTTIQAGSLIAGGNSAVSTNGAFGNAASAIVLGNGSTLVGDAPAILINGAYTVGRDITVGSVADGTVAYNAIIGGSNTTGAAAYTGNITLNTTATNYTATLQAATGGTTAFSTGAWTTNNKALAIGTSGNTGTVSIANSLVTSGGITVNYGTLLLGAANALGGSTTPVTVGANGTLDVHSYADTIKSLTMTAGGTLTLGVGNLLTASAAVTLAGTLNVSGAPTLGSYELLSYASKTGTFTPGTLPASYRLVYNSNSTELDLTHQATFAALALNTSPSNPANVHAGGSQTVYLLIGNTAPAGSSNLNYTLSSNVGSGTGSVNANTTNVPITGTYTPVAGPNSFTISATDPNATNSASVAFAQTGYALAAANTISTPITLTNVHVGGTFGTSALSIQNTVATNSGYSEKLDAAFGTLTGSASASGSINLLTAQSINSSSMIVGLGGSAHTAAAGLVTGTAPITLTSDGTGTSGLGTTALTGQTVTVNGGVFALASANSISTPVTVNAHVNGTFQSKALTIQNTATGAAGYVEDLAAAFGTAAGSATDNSGLIANLLAGTSNNTALTVSLNAGTSTTGAVTGTNTVPVNLTSTGTVNSVSNGLGTTGLTAQTITITGGVYALAAANTISTPITLTNVHVGGTFGTSALSIQNTVAANSGYSEKLDVAFGTLTGSASANGSISLLAAQSTDSSSMTVGLGGSAHTAAAGLVTGTAPITLTSDGTGTSGLGTTALTGQTVTVNGGVYAFAAANTISTPINLPNVHVSGTFGTSALTIQNTVAANGGYSEKLDAAFGTLTGNVTSNGGSISLLAAQTTDSSSMTVGLGGSAHTGSAGLVSGTAPITLTSDGSGTSGLANTGLTGQTITVNGGVYALAAANTISTPITLTNVHVGGTFGTSALTIQNTVATNSGYSEKLDAAFGTLTGSVTSNGGSISLLTAQTTDSSSMTVGLGGSAHTGSAGLVTGTAPITLTSDGTGTSGLASTPLTGQTVTVNGGVYAFAAANSIGTPINLTNVHVGGTFGTSALTIQNTVAANGGYSEKLDAAFGTLTGSASASGSISLLAAQGTESSSMTVGLGGSAHTAAAGLVTGTAPITLTSDGSGTSGLGTTALTGQTVTVTGQVYSGLMNWISTVNGNWNADSSWTDSTASAVHAAPGLDAGFTSSDTATFGSTSAPVTVSLNNHSPNLKGITFDSSDSYTVDASGTTPGGTLILNGGGSGATLTDLLGSHEISAPIILADNLTGMVNSGYILTLSGIISETGGPKSLTKAGDGTLTLTGSNTYSGGTTISAGVLKISNAHALGTGGLILAGGTLDSGNSSITLAGTPQTWNNDLVFQGSADLNMGTGGVTLTATRQATVDGGNLTIDGPITGSTFGLTKTGAGILTLGGSNTYTGNTTIMAGKLALNGAGSINNSPVINVGAGAYFDVSGVTGSNYALASGQTLKGTGTVLGAITVAAGSAISPGNSPGILHTADQTWADGGSYVWEVNSVTNNVAGTNFDQLAITGGLNITATTTPFALKITSLGLATDAGWNANGHYDWIIATTTTGISGSLANITLDKSSFTWGTSGAGFTLSNQSGSLVLDYLGNDSTLSLPTTLTINSLKGGTPSTTLTITNAGSTSGSFSQAVTGDDGSGFSVTPGSGSVGGSGAANLTVALTSSTSHGYGDYGTRSGTVTLTNRDNSADASNHVTYITANVGTATAYNANITTNLTLFGPAMTAAVSDAPAGNNAYANLASSTFLEGVVASGAALGTNGTSRTRGGTAVIAAGDALHSTGTVQMAWRAPSNADIAPLFSDVVELSGFGTDTVVLEMFYSSSFYGTGEAALFLGREIGQSGLWQNAGTVGSKQGAWNGTDLAAGHWGQDLGTSDGLHYVWAVVTLDSTPGNNDFAVIPEPSTLGLLALGATSLLARKRRR